MRWAEQPPDWWYGRSPALGTARPTETLGSGGGFEVGLVKTIDRRARNAFSRRLAAILAADVAGYSRLMGADEERTHERFKVHLRELIDPKINEHRGAL
jgi:class 3 adenylate cyclase